MCPHVDDRIIIAAELPDTLSIHVQYDIEPTEFLAFVMRVHANRVICMRQRRLEITGPARLSIQYVNS